ncbi:indolepyruvate ferredoxin oxidoreductase family protein [Telmatospirillum sp. J64-1]|uniref:indolepyruvate ferredoxin oxidoreductase family protein n=1 Tax=Telmatospirillum sp. J64-1 TaxID=2502183 RepID=UPI00115EB081|nr:indolepyruvate ferredoxin oxidoreductase family protein [Telmatospirillum sp. J64-1]
MTVAAAISLDDKYVVAQGRVFMTGIQALVRLPMLQHQRDIAAGLNTAGFISGYRGSPLGGLDKEIVKAQRFLEAEKIRFVSGLNEDLAATHVWGTQQVGLWPGALHDGVFALWYGKGPGVDRSGDVFKHGNYAGTSPHGGVLLLAGDDHGARSSTLPHQSEYSWMDAQIPVLNPSGVQEILDYGLIGWALSRYSGCWVAMKTISETVESSGTVQIDPFRLTLVEPDDFVMPPGGLHIRWPDRPMEQELRLMRHKLYAALAFARANRIDRVVIDSPRPRLGIVTTGKAYLDVRQALDDLGLDEAHAAEIGLRVYKVGMSWPLEREGIRHFAEGLEEILVVEEKRAVIENQLKEQLYNWREDVRPRVIGKFDEKGEWILPSAGELTPARIARVLAARIARFHSSDRIRQRLDWLDAKEKALANIPASVQRLPWYCAGCPHNTSTVVPEGSRAGAGIGCHYMAIWMNRHTETVTQMGGEGASWIGQAPFTETRHVFQNLGDGTYYHSGSLAIRAAIAAKVNITYKILFNDAVAMTGGQHLEEPLTVPNIARQVYDEGVRTILVVTDEPDKYPLGAAFPPGTRIHHRDELERLQLELRDVPGVSVLIYDQTCAAEKRRRRKRGQMPDPDKRVFINELVCEGCGDCGAKSNCVAVAPVETEFGRKRVIDQSACNKDFSCLKGFCPSFVTVHGGKPRRHEALGAGKARCFDDLPEPVLPSAAEPYGIVITGIGGTGVVTIGALLGMAAHIEGKGSSVLDMTGLAQKNGAVISHLRIADDPEAIHAVRIVAGGANLLLGGDMVVAGSFDALAKTRTDFSRAVINAHETATADFTQTPDLAFPTRKIRSAITEAVGEEAVDFIDATRLASALMGDSIATNLFLVGYAWQKGLIPLAEASILRAIELNNTAIEFNRQAFLWGRRAAHDPAAVEAIALPADSLPEDQRLSQSLDEVIARREAFLVEYQNEAWAARYRKLVNHARETEQHRTPGMEGLTDAVARSAFKLMSYKDEYEVARLYAGDSFRKALSEQFEDGWSKLEFHLAPPAFSRRDPHTGLPVKSSFGPWMMKAFGLLAKMKSLRGTAFDPFGRSEERRMERRLIGEYEEVVAELLAGLSPENHALAVEIAALPQTMRGFGHVKQANVEKAKAREAELLARFRTPVPRLDAAQ